MTNEVFCLEISKDRVLFRVRQWCDSWYIHDGKIFFERGLRLMYWKGEKS